MQDMTRKLRYLFLLLFLIAGNTVFAQSGSISGTVTDKKTNEAVIGAVVEVLQAGTVRGGDVTDEDGHYVVKPLNPGQNFEVRVKYASYKEIRSSGVLVSPDRNTDVNFKMEQNDKELEEVVFTEYKVPLIKRDEPGSTTTLTSKQIEKLPTRNTNDAASLAGGTYQNKSGDPVSIAGARSNGTLYIVDGVQVNGVAGTNFPPGSIDQISVITSGIPAKYGDASGGVISITTKGPSSMTTGSVGFEHSVDGYNHNLAYFNVQGPLLKKKIDSVNKKSVLGYSLSGQYQYDEDNDPTYTKNYVLNSAKLAEIRNNPLVLSNSGGQIAVRSATEYITMKDLETRKARVNADYRNARLVGKLDYQVSDNMNITVGGNLTYITNKSYSRAYTLFAPESIPEDKSITGRGFIRFTQKFGKPNVSMEEGKEKKTPLISNAYYSLQADYQTTYGGREDPNHRHNAFKYGYVGKFDRVAESFYGPGVVQIKDSITGEVIREVPGITLYTYDNPIAISYTRSETNPLLANYTSQLYSVYTPRTLGEIAQLGAMRNGDAPASTYGKWANVGNSYAGYRYTSDDQFAFSVDASFDLQPKKTRHAIEFGLYYQQRSERFYGINASSLWNQMRLLTNRHLTGLDTDHPVWVINGQNYTWDQLQAAGITPSPFDTVVFNRFHDDSLQSNFDKNLRASLNLDPNGSDYLNIDGMDPSQFSLDMFSADEIINSGNNIANYYGYDYTGKRLNGQVNFNDWFTKKDANGNYTRQIGAFRPNYIAGYIMDKFELKNNTLFHLGLRVERFDANTKVLKDPYSIYAVHNVGSSDAVNNLNGKTPDNIGSDYVVYVTDNASTNPQVIGYRNGDDWYDPFGKYIADPSVLKNYSGGRDPQPYLQKTGGTRALTMKDANYDPNTSFTDYKPQVNAMPRISFTFPIADQAMFYAHYDVLVQRPKTAGEIYASPADYYYINQNSNQIIANPDLKPEKVFDYEFGFQQQLGRNSAVTITGFYKERKDQIQVRPYLYAWPNTYSTYGNRDFSTTKGFTLKYDLRPLPNDHFSMQLSYTLQFAEGTGSSSSSSGGLGNSGLLAQLVGAQLPNLRFAFPLDFDSRHILNANVDYRYDDKEGPVIAGTHALENAGVNLVFRARSGEPYTKRDQPNSPVVQGGVQGSRLPWHYMMDLRVDKTFGLSFGKKSAEGIKRPSRYGITAFAYITNLLNTRDVLNVNGFTGRPDDDGYLASPQGQQEASIKVSKESFTDLYQLSVQNPDNLNNPRRINLGVSFDF